MGTVYAQLSLCERRKIENWWHAKVPVREMARILKRSKATIHREIKRNFWADDALPKKYAGYFGHAAQLQTNKRRSVQRKLIRHPELCKAVIARIKQGWTPEQIGNRMIYEGAKPRVCQETIYRYIYSKEGMEQELWWYLPEHRKARRPRRARKRQKPKFDRDVSILFRPDDVARLCCKLSRMLPLSRRFSGGERAMNDFKGRHFNGEVVLWAVLWYCRYGLSYRDLEAMMAERGVHVDHSTIYRWVQHYAPEMERRMRWQWRRPMSDNWRVDETYIKVRGKWTYLYRAVDKLGNTVDFYLSSTRNAKAAKRFLGKAIRACKDWEKPSNINTDKAGCYTQAIRELKQEGKCPKDVEHRQVKYLNNVIEADHGKLKQLIKPVHGFKTMRTAYATIKGFEVMRALRKGQGRAYNLTRDPIGEKRMIERAFGVGPCAMAEAVAMLEKHFAA